MNKIENKLIPKVKRKLKSFLTDESGKIARKDALGMAVGAGFLFAATLQDTSATHSNWGGHNNHSQSVHSSAQCGHVNQAHGSGYDRNGHLSGNIPGTASLTLNGHYSALPTAGHQSGFIQGAHGSQAAVNDGRHCNGTGHANHSNY